ncbi:hypothetical protein Gogos_014092 [Gossypium gossypioides]|uniref:Uncharacterized protein n=1 Tax=Gossypium gossypioides TaxID=34282 RepID=A0A7J9BXI4_GOSGO|nr:hypothetical protein [Gossypium gossypioides]
MCRLGLGLLVEDFYTGFRLKCEGWRSIFCNPEKAAFMGNAPLNLLDVPFQNKRWQIGLLEVASSKYSPITFGVKAMGLFMGLGYSSYAYSSILSIPITTYSFVPQLALLNGLNIFPKVSEPWFLLYVLVFLGAYGQDFLEHCVGGGTIQRWWSDQRLWMIKGLSCFLFGLTEFLLKSMFQQGNGVNAIVVISFNHLPIYEAMVLRSDKGKMPIRISFTATTLVLAVYSVASLVLK